MIIAKNKRIEKRYFVSNNIKYTLPLLVDVSEENYYYYDQAGEGLDAPIVMLEKKTRDFKKDVLDNYNNSFTEEELDYIFQLYPELKTPETLDITDASVSSRMFLAICPKCGREVYSFGELKDIKCKCGFEFIKVKHKTS